MNVVSILGELDDDEASLAASEAVHHVSDAIDRLDEQLADAVQRINKLKVVRAELELGDMFNKAERFVETTIANAEERARQIVKTATEQAARIIEEARREAGTITDAARREAGSITEEAKRSTTPSPEVIRELNQAIDGFMSVNRQLVMELGYLRTMVVPAA
jgi:cell division septum initiation protein DivIVA